MKRILFLVMLIPVLFLPVVAGGQGFVEFTSYYVGGKDVSRIDLKDPIWKGVKPYRQVLQPQFLEIPKPQDVGVKEVYVQSVNDGKYIVFRLTWKDSTLDDSVGLMKFSDGAALQFPADRDALPQFFMGEKNKPVHILYWKAWASRDKEKGFQSVETAYPNMTVDMYNFDYKIKAKGTDKTQEEKSLFIPGRAAKNPVSYPGKEVVEELTSSGPGTITHLDLYNTTGEARWENDQWTVLFRRPLRVDDRGSVKFTPGEKMPVAFAIWEGSFRETGGRKAVSPAWAEVEVATPR